MSKKVKGQKVDLAAFIGSSVSEAALPSAPNPNRDPNDYGRRRRDGPNDRGGGRGDRMESRGGFGGGGDYGGSNSDSWGRDSMPRCRDGNGGDSMMTEEPWQRRNTSDGGGFGMGSINRPSFRNSSQGSSEPALVRPDHLRIKLEPRTLPLPETTGDTSGAPSLPLPSQSQLQQKEEDKWAKAFKKHSSISSSGRDDDSRFRRGEFGANNRENLSGNSWGDSSRGGGDLAAYGVGRPRGVGYQGGRVRENEEVEDPRFSKLFSNRGKDMQNQPYDRNTVRESPGAGDYFKGSNEGPSNNPKTASSSLSVASVPIVKSSDDDAALKALALKAAKEAKAAERLEKERQDKDRKEAIALKEKELAEIARQANELALENAVALFHTGAKGNDLKSQIQELDADKRPSGPALLEVVLDAQFDKAPMKWCIDGEYGASLKFLLAGDTKAQVQALFAVQNFCSKRGFPKIEIKEKSRKIVDLIFQLLYRCGIMDAVSFTTWSDDDRDDIPGKKSALFHTGDFFVSLQEEEDEEDEDNDEDEDIDDEIDAPREIVK